MPSPPRDLAPGLHHAWVNATSHWPYFADDVDRVAWLRLLVATLDRFHWTCVAFCQMTTHVHAIIDVPEGTLASGMHFLNLGYSRHFNTRHGRFGHLVRKRYGNRRIEDGRDLLGTYAYVALNPVVEGMCPRPEDWRWSSYATTLGLSSDFTFVDASLVLAEIGGSTAALRRFVAEQQVARTAAMAMAR